MYTKFMRRVIFLLAAVLMISYGSVVYAGAREVDSGVCENIRWTIMDDGTLTISGQGNMPQWTNSEHVPWRTYQSFISNVIIEDGVTSIGFCAFSDCKNVKTICIPDSITYISNSAFKRCESLKSISIPNSVTTLEYEAFYDCVELESVKLSNNISRIESETFRGCKKLNSISLPDNVTFIGWRAFYECSSLKRISIPDAVSEINADAFWGCSMLNDVEMSESFKDSILDVETYFKGTQFALNNKSIKGACGEAVFWELSSEGILEITGSGAMNPTYRTIMPWDAYSKLIKKVVVSEGVTSVCDWAFQGCSNLRKIELSSTVAVLGSILFDGCFDVDVVLKRNDITVHETAFHSVKKDNNIRFYYPEKSWSGIKPLNEYGITNLHAIQFVPYCVLDDNVPMGHIEKILDGKPSTCTETGLSDGKQCSICQMIIISQEPIPSSGHTEIDMPGIVATCITAGKTTGKFCTTCQTVTVPQTDIVATGHVANTEKVEKATVTADGTIITSCTCGEVLSTEIIPAASKITLSKSAYTYTGKKIKAPTVAVKDSDGKVIAKANYTVVAPKNMKAIGRYTYTIKFKGDQYSGTQKVTLEIKPAKTTLKSATAAKKAVTVKWTKGKKDQVTGYEVMVATNKNFTIGKKVVNVKGFNKTSTKISKLTSKKTYYVKVRTYKTVKGVKIYSDWSKVKTVKVK